MLKELFDSIMANLKHVFSVFFELAMVILNFIGEVAMWLFVICLLLSVGLIMLALGAGVANQAFYWVLGL